MCTASYHFAIINSCMLKLAKALEKNPLAVEKTVENKSLHVFIWYEDKQFFKILDQVVLCAKKGKGFLGLFSFRMRWLLIFVSLHLEAPKLHGFILFSAKPSSLAYTIFISTADITSCGTHH